MARDFDGTNDRISFGAAASVGDFVTKSVAMYVVLDSIAADLVMTVKDRFTSVWGWQYGAAGAGFTVRVNFDGGQGVWNAAASFGVPTTGRIYHMAITYDGSAVTNNPTLWVDGVSYAFANTLQPIGTISPDAADPLLIGTNDINGNDLDGQVGWFCYANAVWDAAAVNRARWWGRPHGGVAVYHPLVTDKLVNEGSATANGTATGTTIASLAAPVVRPGTALIGMGVGW